MNAPTPEPNPELEEAADKEEERGLYLLLLLQRKAAQMLDLNREPATPDTWEETQEEGPDD